MMDSYELSKIAGAVFAALLTIVVPRTIIDMSRHGHGATASGFTLPSAEPAAAPEAAASATGAAKADAPAAGSAKADAAPPAAGGTSIAGLLAAASAENGKAAFSKCASCHTVNKGGANSLGPNLWGIVGRKIGGVDGFGYSAALKKKGEEGAVWDYDHLARWIQADDKLIPGNKMIFPGMADPATQADVVAYLRSLADQPAPLPK